ncbi:hypothetical protein, partial [Vibrio breoganii]|uniref:hypothetical protein n=1 Tax=Vibrio breoganii TaxID=553239 RepID=UPI00111294BC
ILRIFQYDVGVELTIDYRLVLILEVGSWKLEVGSWKPKVESRKTAVILNLIQDLRYNPISLC